MIPNVKYNINTIINIPKGGESYFHLYFNDGINEIKKYSFTDDDEFIQKIKIIIDEEITSFEYLFEECLCIKKITFIKFNRVNINNMHGMFMNC